MVLLLPACTSGGKSGTSATATTTAKAITPTSARAADITLTGDATLTGAISNTSVRCNFPSLDGQGIAVLARAADSTSLARVAVHATKVKVIISSGEGPDYHERVFEGTGVTGFDPAKRAVVDASLTESTPPVGARPRTVGAVTAIKGTVECGDQTAGSSTVVITGETPAGTLAAVKLDPVRAECYRSPDGDEVVASGLAKIGTTTALIGISLQSDGGISLTETVPTATRRYLASGTTTVTPNGGDLRGDVVEQGIVAASAHRLHVEGELTCGVNATG
jgi:hypothetical protein